MTYPRPLRTSELAVLDRFAELLDTDQAEIFRDQLRAASVKGEDIGHLFFVIPPDTHGLNVPQYLLDGYYADFDGVEVVMTVHFVGRPRYISWFEKFRSAPLALEKLWPSPDEVVFHRPTDDHPRKLM
jgi:hypothetical protein